MSQQNLLFVVISIFSAPESRGGVREEIPDRALRWSEPESVLSPVLLSGPGPELTGARGGSGSDWPTEEAGAGEGMV